MNEKLLKLLKIKLIVIYSVTVFITISLSYSSADIFFNHGANFAMPSNPMLDDHVSIKYIDDNENYSHNESFYYHVISDVAGVNGGQYYSIRAPKGFPFIYPSIVDNWVKSRGSLNKNKDLENKTIKIIRDIFKGDEHIFFKNMSRSNKILMDHSILISLSKKYHVNPYNLYKYYLSIPINHELGHIYVKRTIYHDINVSYELPVFIDEFIAEYISAITTISMVANDFSIKNKKVFVDALADIYILSRTREYELLSEHTGTAFVSTLLLNKDSFIYRDANDLSKTRYPKEFIKNIVRKIAYRKESNEEQRFNDTFLSIYLNFYAHKKNPEKRRSLEKVVNTHVLSILDVLYNDGDLR